MPVLFLIVLFIAGRVEGVAPARLFLLLLLLSDGGCHGGSGRVRCRPGQYGRRDGDRRMAAATAAAATGTAAALGRGDVSAAAAGAPHHGGLAALPLVTGLAPAARTVGHSITKHRSSE